MENSNVCKVCEVFAKDSLPDDKAQWDNQLWGEWRSLLSDRGKHPGNRMVEKCARECKRVQENRRSIGRSHINDPRGLAKLRGKMNSPKLCWVIHKCFKIYYSFFNNLISFRFLIYIYFIYSARTGASSLKILEHNSLSRLVTQKVYRRSSFKKIFCFCNFSRFLKNPVAPVAPRYSAELKDHSWFKNLERKFVLLPKPEVRRIAQGIEWFQGKITVSFSLVRNQQLTARVHSMTCSLKRRTQL